MMPSTAASLRRTLSSGDLPRTSRTNDLSGLSSSRRSEGHQPSSSDALNGAGPGPPDNLTQQGDNTPPEIDVVEDTSMLEIGIQVQPETPPRMQRPSDPPPVTRISPPRRNRNRSLLFRTLNTLGLGPNVPFMRKALRNLVFTLAFGFCQVVVIVVILALSGTRLKSPTSPELTEWTACDRPLGIWACVWIIRTLLSCILHSWDFVRLRQRRRRNAQSGEAPALMEDRIPDTPSAPNRHAAPVSQPQWSNTSNSEASAQDASSSEASQLPFSHLYHRLTLLSSVLTLSWFITAQILQYTSVNTCRWSAPHVWWLSFAILCISYFKILEVVLLAAIVLFIGPILVVFWNIFMLCLGRHPIQNPNIIHPDIGKLSKSIVDQIPLVLYIPPPPSDFSQLSPQEITHSYPPTRPLRPKFKPRFKFLFQSADKDGDKGAPVNWEDNWKGSNRFPFVILEENRARCAICMEDFQEPKRVGDKAAPSPTGQGTDTDQERNEPPTPGGDVELIYDQPRAVAGSGKTEKESERAISRKWKIRRSRKELNDHTDSSSLQPLRLLTCGHVFHKTCLDPWLTTVSGRCPTCQQAVEIPE